MSEEIKDIFECLKKYANLTPDAIDDLYYLQGYIEEKMEEIDRLNNIIKQIEELCDKHELGKYDYSVPVFELKEVIKSENIKSNK